MQAQNGDGEAADDCKYLQKTKRPCAKNRVLAQRSPEIEHVSLRKTPSNRYEIRNGGVLRLAHCSPEIAPPCAAANATSANNNSNNHHNDNGNCNCSSNNNTIYLKCLLITRMCVCAECKSCLPCLVSKFSHKPCCRFTHKKTSPRIHQDTIAIKLPVRVLCCFVSHPPSLLTSRKFASKSFFCQQKQSASPPPGPSRIWIIFDSG